MFGIDRYRNRNHHHMSIDLFNSLDYFSCNSAFSFFLAMCFRHWKKYFFSMKQVDGFFLIHFSAPRHQLHINTLLYTTLLPRRSIYGSSYSGYKTREIFARKEKVLKGERNVSHYKGQVLNFYVPVHIFFGLVKYFFKEIYASRNK